LSQAVGFVVFVRFARRRRPLPPVRKVLEEEAGVRVEAARRLGVDRTTLYRLMRKYGIESGD
jgi:transcriptional regulator with GAF, ATPase, and Fis domain